MNDPGGNSPDSPAAGEAGVLCPGGEVISGDATADCAGRDIPYKFFGLSPAWVSLDGIHWHEVPDGTSIQGFLAELSGNQALGPFPKNSRNSP